MKKKIILICSISFFAMSCSKSVLDEIDRNPNVVNDAPLKSLLPQVIMRYAYEINGGGTAVTVQFLSEQTTFNLGDNILQGLSGKGESLWTNAYLLLKNLEILKQKATEQQAWTYVGIADVLKASTMSHLVDLFGDVPYLEALDASISSPKFDDDEQLFGTIQSILDDAIASLQKDPGTIKPSGDDVVFKGNAQMWIKTAYGQKARLYNRLSNLDPTGSATKALAAIQNSFANASENFDVKIYTISVDNDNPFVSSQVGQPQSSVGNGIWDAMLYFSLGNNIQDDPRANIWFTKVNGKLLPAPNGTAQPDFGDPRLDGAKYSKPAILKIGNAPQPMLTFAELKFIEAEANLRLGNLSGANTAYETAVSIALDEASKFNPAVALTTQQKSDYKALPVVFPGSGNLSLKTIIYQKYIYFFQYQPIEAFNDFRRTGLFNVTDPNGSPTRLPYPNSELVRNANTPTNVNDFSVLDSSTKLFWSK